MVTTPPPQPQVSILSYSIPSHSNLFVLFYLQSDYYDGGGDGADGGGDCGDSGGDGGGDSGYHPHHHLKYYSILFHSIPFHSIPSYSILFYSILF